MALKDFFFFFLVKKKNQPKFSQIWRPASLRPNLSVEQTRVFENYMNK